MNDRFKFRYFNKYANKMVEPENWQNVDGIYECLKQQVCFDNDIMPLPYDHIGDGLVFMQCTGLKDKNGKLIFEGDIVKCYFTNTDTEQIDYDLMKVIFDDNASAFGLEGLRTSSLEYFSYFEFNSEEYEVIGNIYTDAHLLEEYKDED